jgi:gliding motility-associated-like protein
MVQGNTACGTVLDTLVALAITEQTGLTYSIDSDCTNNIATITLHTIGTPSLLWSTGATGLIVSTTLPLTLVVDAGYSCSVVRDTIDLPACAVSGHHLYIPDAFSPNGDGVNDVFEIFGDKVNWLYLSINIYDRWGEKVFVSNDLDFKWDGNYHGARQSGFYVYTLNIFYDNQQTDHLKGSLTLIR